MQEDITGDLGFRTDFAGGNGLASFRLSLGDGPTIVELSALCRGGSVPLWFHTKIAGLGEEAIHLRIANAAQMNGDAAGWAGNTIVVRDGDGGWVRSPLPIIEDDAAGVMRVAYPLRLRNQQFEVASCFPYQHDELLHAVRDTRHWEAARIGRSAGGRVIERYRLGSHTSPASKERDKQPSIYIVGGQCAGETSANWVLDGLMRSAGLDVGESGRGLDWWVVPCVDVDGRDDGCYGRGLFGGDFDQAWGEPCSRTEVRAVMLDMERWAHASKPRLVINLQGTSHADRSTYLRHHQPAEMGSSDPGVINAEIFMSEFASRIKTLSPVQTLCPARIVDQIGGLRPGFTDTPCSWPVWTSRQFGVPAFTVAVSMQGSPDHDFGIEDYQRIGHGLYGVISSMLRLH